MRPQNLTLEEVLGELLEAEDTGKAPSLAQLEQEYPAYATQLREYLDNRAMFHRFSAPIQLESPGAIADKVWRHALPAQDRIGEYELVAEIARGGMGVVFVAKHAVVGRLVALKMILDGRFASESQRERFLNEARAAARLDHPNIVPVYEVSQHDAQPYFTMKLVQGPSLAARLETLTNQPRCVARLVMDVARALHYAHQRGIIHRDLKPANILLEETTHGSQQESLDDKSTQALECRWRPLIADFGLAKLRDVDGELTQAGEILGTPVYMAPEQAAGSANDVATTMDVYSLGAIFYALLTGKPAFHGGTPAETLRRVVHEDPAAPRKINPQVPHELEIICLKCLEKEPRRRYGSAEALADDLNRWFEHRPIHARRNGFWEHTLKWARRRPATAILVFVSTLATFVLLASSLWYNARLNTEMAKVNHERQRAEDNSSKLEDRELTARRHAYGANMSLAYQAWNTGHLAQSLRLLSSDIPRTDEFDLRSFDWHHLAYLAHRDLKQVFGSGPGPVRGVHFSPDSRQIIYAGADGVVRIRDLISGEHRDWKAHEGPIRSTAISPNGDCLATLDNDGVLKVWNLSDGSQRFTWRPQRRLSHFYTVTSSLAFTADSKRLALISEGVPLLDAKTGQELGRCKLDGDLNAVSFTQDAQTLVVATNNRGVLLVQDVSAGQSPEMLGDDSSYVLAIAMSPDGTTLASSSEDGILKLWDLENRREVARFEEHTGAIYCLAYSPGGERIASGGEDGTVTIRDLAGGSLRLFAHPGTVYSLAFSADGKFLATGDAHGQLRLWDLRVSDTNALIHAHRGTIYSLSFSPDGKTLVSGGKDRAIRFWDVETGMQRAILEGHTGSVTSLAHVEHGATLISGNCFPGNQAPKPSDEGGSVRFWDVVSRRLIASVPAHKVATWGLAVAPDGQTFATAGYRDNSVKLYDVKSRRLLGTLTGHSQRVWSVAFSPDGRLLASSSASDSDDEATVFIWDVATQSLRNRLQVRWVWSIAFSPSGNLLATGSEGGLVKLWNMQSGLEAVAIQGHTTAVKCVAFSPDGKILASASADKTIRLWDISTGDERARLKGHEKEIFSLAFSSDGKTLASGDADGTIRLWRSENKRK